MGLLALLETRSLQALYALQVIQRGRMGETRQWVYFKAAHLRFSQAITMIAPVMSFQNLSATNTPVL
jgi:hypothetical protein